MSVPEGTLLTLGRRCDRHFKRTIVTQQLHPAILMNHQAFGIEPGDLRDFERCGMDELRGLD